MGLVATLFIFILLCLVWWYAATYDEMKRPDDGSEQKTPPAVDQSGVPDEVRQLEWERIGSLIDSSEGAGDDERA